MSWSRAIVGALCLCAFGCDEVSVEPLRPGSDGGFMEGPPPGCEDVWPAVTVFANNCAVSGACHVPGGQYPDLTRAGMYDLVDATSEANPSETLVVANDPEASWLYRKMTGTQGEDGGLLMPMGTDEPIDAVGTIEAWINAGAPTACEGDEPPPPPVPVDPNALDQGELFTCATPDTGSVSRIRRVERTMWTHSTGNTLGSGAHQNPLYAPEGDYTTYSEDVSVDPSTLDLYMTVLPRAGSMWRGREAWPRLWPVYSEPTIRCIYGDSEPDDECIDFYVDTLLTQGVIFRTPTDGERAQVREYLVERMAAEDESTTRADTLTQVASAAWMMSGALFRPELGEPVEGDPTGRRRLTDDELALAVGNLLSTHPPGSALPTSGEDRGGEPDASNPELGYLGQVRAAADDGTIQDPEVIRSLIQTYRGGVDEGRADIYRDSDSRDLPSRGEYWLASRIRGFFREWLDYESANTAFKDTPTATTPTRGTRRPRGPSATSSTATTATSRASSTSSTTRSRAPCSRRRRAGRTSTGRCSPRGCGGCRRTSRRPTRMRAARTRTARTRPTRAARARRACAARASRTTRRPRTTSTASTSTSPPRRRAAGSRCPRASAPACSRTRPG